MKAYFLIFKIVSTILLLYLVIANIDFSIAKSYLLSVVGIKAIIVSVICALLQILLAGFRLVPISKMHGYIYDTLSGCRLCFMGTFFSQSFLSFLGGDAVRVWSLTRGVIDARVGTSIIFLDRVLGFVALIISFLVVLPVLMQILDSNQLKYAMGLLAGAGLLAILLFFGLGWLRLRHTKIKLLNVILDLSSISRYLYISAKNSFYALAASFGIHMLSVISIYLSARIYHIDLSLFWCFVIVIPVTFLTMLPISIAGWGVRESAMMVGVGLIGLGPEYGLMLSITLGIALVISSLPGLLIFLLERNSQKQVASRMVGNVG